MDPVGSRIIESVAIGLPAAKHGERPGLAQPRPNGEVVLSENSPKRDYIKEITAQLVQRPLMEPVTGKMCMTKAQTVEFLADCGPGNWRNCRDWRPVREGDALAELDSPDLGQAQSAYSDALADLNLAERAYQRIKELADNGITPRKELDQAEDNLSHAKSEAERARLKLANLGVRSRRTDNRFILHAPISGAITERNINPGMEVKAGPYSAVIRDFRSGSIMGTDGYFREGYRLDPCGGKSILARPRIPDRKL